MGLWLSRQVFNNRPEGSLQAGFWVVAEMTRIGKECGEEGIVN